MNNLTRIAVSFGRDRPIATPTALGMALLAILFGISLLVPDRPLHGATSGNTSARPAVSAARPRRPVSLRDRLVVGLQARLKSEVEFIELVVLKVHTGKIPQRIVDETFFWARNRAASGRAARDRRPIIYFQPAMAARARRLGVKL